MEISSLEHCAANYVPLSPISFLERAATVYGTKTSIVYGDVRFSWRDTYERCLKLASALVHLGVTPGDVVATLAPNIPALYELHFGVPMAGAVLSALNTSLDAPTLALLLSQLDAKLLFVDYHFFDLALKSLDTFPMSMHAKSPPKIVFIPECDQQTLLLLIPDKKPNSCGLTYNALLAMASDASSAASGLLRPNNECDPISVNFTSGSTGDPKAIVYTHRAAYLNSLAQIFRCDLRHMPVFLWTVDMFRCNGWCLAWAMAALGGTNVCLRNVSAQLLFDALLLHEVTHLCGPPSILSLISDAPPTVQRQLPRKVNVLVAGAMPNSSVLLKVEELGFNVIHGYGMTEALGPAIVSPWRQKLAESSAVVEDEEQCREGLHNLLIEGVDVKDQKTMKSVPHDGKTIGEVMLRSNTLMLGYHRNTEATKEAFRDGWYHTGDLGVRHPNGCIQIKDRARDIIITGEASVSTLEVEAVLLRHPEIAEAAVVGKPESGMMNKEVPCAFVKLKEGGSGVGSAEEIIKFCGNHLPDYMVPKVVVFGDLPLNFNGKVQKHVLRIKANVMCTE